MRPSATPSRLGVATNGLVRVIVRLLTPYFLRKAVKEGTGTLQWLFDHRIDWTAPAGPVAAEL